MAKVWPLKLAPTDKLVLLALADNANDDGHCWPRVAVLCERTSLSDRAIQHSMTRLVEAGHVTVTPRYKQSNVFLVHPQEYPERRSPEPTSPEAPSPEFPSPERKDVLTRTSFTHIEDNRHRTVSSPGVVLHESLPRESWDEWIAHRREKRWSMSPRALNPQLKLLAKYDTETQREILETSMQAGWQGLFPPKGKQKPKESQQWM